MEKYIASILFAQVRSWPRTRPRDWWRSSVNQKTMRASCHSCVSTLYSCHYLFFLSKHSFIKWIKIFASVPSHLTSMVRRLFTNLGPQTLQWICKAKEQKVVFFHVNKRQTSCATMKSHYLHLLRWTSIRFRACGHKKYLHDFKRSLFRG